MADKFSLMIRPTHESEDVKASFRSITESKTQKDLYLVFDVKDFNFESHASSVKVEIKTYLNKTELFSKIYEERGQSQGGKMVFGGAFAMKNAIQQSTKLAMDKILKDYLQDLRAKMPKEAKKAGNT